MVCDPLKNCSTVGQTEEALERVWEYLERYCTSKFALWNPDDKSVKGEAIDGYKCVIENGKHKHYKFYVVADTFRDDVCKGLDHTQVCRELERLGLTKRDGDNNFTHLIRPPKSERSKFYIISSTIEVESEEAAQSEDPMKTEDASQDDGAGSLTPTD